MNTGSVIRVLAVLCVVGVAVFSITIWAQQKGTLEGTAMYTKIVTQEQQKLQQQQSSLAANSSQLYQGDDFSINVPTGWSENSYAENQWQSNFGQSKVWETAGATVVGTNPADQELDVVWNTDTASGPINKNESVEVSSDKGSPDQYTITHPTVFGADAATMIVPTQLYSDGYQIMLFVHAKGKIYFIEGNIQQGTQAQADGLQQIIASFKVL